MAKRGLKPEDIKVVSYVHVGDKLVNTDDLNEEQKRRLANALAVGWLNGLFAGQAVFYAEDPMKDR
ncbi:MAG: hypothetical protein J5482_02795 [Oscillospiraceae bacterium]|nr:hypothetical protein [Oscillospiraceae bacterium]